MEAKDYIQEYGGKAGGWFYLRDFGGFENHLLPCTFFFPEQDEFEISANYPEGFPPVIVRSSHPNDYAGLVDAISTQKGAKNRFDLELAVETIRSNAKCEEVLSYNEFEGQSYDGRVGIMVQPQNNGIRGNIVEHPHERGTYLLDFVDEGIGDGVISIDHVVSANGELDDLNKSLLRSASIEDVRRVINLYKMVRETDFVGKDYSFQMEFGINERRFKDKEKILFYQARLFNKFVTPPFELDGDPKYQCFGVTPKEGVVLPVIKTFHADPEVNEATEPFAWVIRNMTLPMPLWVQPRKMKAFLPIGSRVNSLEHNTFRWARRAEVSITAPTEEFNFEKLHTGDYVNIRSNGICYEIERV